MSLGEFIFFGEDNIELDIEVAVAHSILEERKTLANDLLSLSIADDFALLTPDGELLAI